MNHDELRRRYEQAKSARRHFEPTWAMNLSFLEGEQWVGYAGGKLYRPSLSDDRVTLVENWILPAVRKEVAKLTKHRPTFSCTPRTAGDEDIAAAELAEQILDYHWTHLGLPTHFPRALLWSRAVSAGYLKAIWDPSLGEGTQVLVGPDGEPLTGGDGRPLTIDVDPNELAVRMGLPPGSIQRKSVAQGDIRIVVRSAFQIFPDPLAETLEEAEWLIEESIASADHVEDRYGKRVEPDTAANPGLVQAQLNSQGGRSGDYRGVRLFEFWRRPCRRYPQGFTATWTEKELLESNEQPFDPMPYVQFRGIDLPGRFHPTCTVEQLRDTQVERNKTISQMAENRNRISHPHPVVDRTAVGNLDEFEEAMGTIGAPIYVDPTSNDPYPRYLQPPELPQYVDRYLDRNNESFQQISGQHDVSNAQVPVGVTAASALNLLQEQDDTQLGPAIADMETQLGVLGTKILRLTARFYDDTRTIALASENYGWEITDFKGAMLRDHTHVRVEAGSTMPKTLAAKQAFMESTLTTMLQNGVPLNQRQLAKYFRDMQIGGFEHLIDEFTVDEMQIRSENRLLSMGRQLQVNEYDDDDAHVEGHEAVQKQPRYQRLPDPIKMVFEAHVEEHRQRIADIERANMFLQMAPDLAQSGQRLEINAAQASQQMAQGQMQHDQRLSQGEEMHQQRIAQMQAQRQAQPA